MRMRALAMVALVVLACAPAVAGGDVEKGWGKVKAEAKRVENRLERTIHKVGDKLEVLTGVDLDWKDDIDHILNELGDELGIEDGISTGICYRADDVEGADEGTVFPCSPGMSHAVAGAIAVDDEGDTESPNSPPEVVVDKLRMVRLAVGESKELNLARAFVDNDGDPLTISSRSQHPEVFDVVPLDSESPERIVVTGKGVGIGTIIVAAKDPGGKGVLLLGRIDVCRVEERRASGR